MTVGSRVVLGELCLLAGTQIMKQFCMGQILAAGVVVHLNQAQKAGKPNLEGPRCAIIETKRE